MTPDPIFIVGTERSGSNLLRVILACHPRLAVPHPPHIVRFFRPIEASYGDLTKDGPFRGLAGDVARLIRWHIYPWDVPVDPERAIRDAPRRDCFGLYVAYMEQYREAHQGARWVCKSTFMIDEIGPITEVFPEPRIVMLVRDPRDVAVSSRQSVFSTFHPYFTAKLWASQQEAGLRWLPVGAETPDTRPPSTPDAERTPLPPHTMTLLRYEDLLTAPEATLRSLCAFIGEDYDPKMLHYFESKEAKRSASLAASWQNTAAPLRGDRVGRYRTGLSPEELRIVEAVTHRSMVRLGYVPEHALAELEAVRFSEAEIASFIEQDRRERRRVELRSLREDKNYLQRVRRDAWVAWLRWRHGG